MRNRLRALLVAVIGLVAAATLAAPAANAWMGCLPHYDPETHEISTLCY